MKPRFRHALLAAALITGIAACGGDDDAADTPAGSSTEPSPAATTGTATDQPSATEAPEGSDGDGPAPTIPTEPGGPSVPGGSGKPVRWGTTTQPTSFDPATVGNAANRWYLEPIYDTLIDALENGQLVPGLATEWALADDAMSLDLTLREGVTFQDGEPFDADAVVANFEHFRADDSLLKADLAVIDSVEVIDPLHVRLHFNRAGGDVPQVLSGFPGMMVSPASIAAGTTSTEPVGAGPFTINTITDSSATYDYWDGYWAAETIIPRSVEVVLMTDDAARLNAVRSGQLDAAIIRPNQLAETEAAGLQGYRVPSATAYGIAVNASNPVLADPDVRRAISQAIDREGIVIGLLDNECTISAQPYPAEHWAYSPDIDEAEYVVYDPDAARAAIEAAAPDGLSLKIVTVTVTAYQRIAEVLQESLAQVGVDATIEALDPAAYYAAGRSGDYDLWVTLFAAASPDPSTWAEQNYRVAPGSAEFIDPDLPELIQAVRETSDQAAQGKAIGQVTAAALEAGTNQIVICLPAATWAVAPGVTGFSLATAMRHMLVP